MSFFNLFFTVLAISVSMTTVTQARELVVGDTVIYQDLAVAHKGIVRDINLNEQTANLDFGPGNALGLVYRNIPMSNLRPYRPTLTLTVRNMLGYPRYFVRIGDRVLFTFAGEGKIAIVEDLTEDGLVKLNFGSGSFHNLYHGGYHWAARSITPVVKGN